MSLPLLNIKDFKKYSEARRQFMGTMGCEESCRDPLSEFAERIVCLRLNGKLAESRTQKGYDLTSGDNRRVQVKHLSNPEGKWRNEHRVSFPDDLINCAEDYALVFFEGLCIKNIILFPKEGLGDVCSKLKKKHSNQESVLQLTQLNYKALCDDNVGFEQLGVKYLAVPGGDG